MKSPLIHIFLLIGLSVCFGRTAFGQDTSKIDIKPSILYEQGYPKRPPQIYDEYDVPPEPPGGYWAYMNFIKHNIKYPKEALAAKASGTVYISLVIDGSGKQSDVQVQKDNAHYGCGDEAIRVVKMIWKWKPGTIKGKPVSIRYVIPVKFVLP